MTGVKNIGSGAALSRDNGVQPVRASPDLARDNIDAGIPPEFLGVPLVDFDLPGDETFVVVARRFGKQIVYRFSKEESLYIFPANSLFRQFVIFITTNQYFEIFILLLIISNCVILAFNSFPEEVEYVFAALYTTEMIMKIIGKGFCLHRYAYLRDPWNWMDFVVVILGYLTLAPRVGNLSGIRTFRVLRALRTISVVDGLKTMVNAFLRSMRMLTDVLILAMFFISIFALVGMQLFVGVLRNKCVLNPGQNATDFEAFLANNSNWLYVNDKPVVCGNSSTARSCPVNYTCFPDVGDNPNHGYTNFDTFPWALVCTIQLVTADFWENIYEHIIASGGFWYLTYFLVVIFFGSFYLLNLILAVVALSYQQELANLKSQAAGYNETRKFSSFYSLHVSVQPQRLFETKVTSRMSNWSLVLHRLTGKSPYGDNTGISAGAYLPTVPETQRVSSPRPPTVPCPIIVESGSFSDVNLPLDSDVDLTLKSKPPLKEQENVVEKYPAENLKLEPLPSRLEAVAWGESDVVIKNRLSVDYGLMVVKTSSLCVVIPSVCDVHGHRSVVNSIRRRCARIIVHPVFDPFITAVISLNTIFMAMEYHGMKRQLKTAVDIVNLVCTFIFILEMLIKVTALFPRGYIQSRWNLLDGFIVLMSIVDLGLFLCEPKVTHGIGFSVIRALRLIRVFKLAQSWVTMRSLLSTIGGSIGQLGNLTLLLGIVAYTFAVIGMHLFSESFHPDKFHDDDVPRWNFSNFSHSFMIIFRVLCGEWIEPLIDTMHATSPAAILFYFAVLILGNFLILNLFLALLLNSFATESLNTSNKHSDNVRGRFRRIVKKLMDVLRAFRITSVSSETNMQQGQADNEACGETNDARDRQEPEGSSRTREGQDTDMQEVRSVSCGIPADAMEKDEHQNKSDSVADKQEEKHEKTPYMDKCRIKSHDTVTSVKHSRNSLQGQKPVVPKCFPSFCCPGIGQDGHWSLVYSALIVCRSKVLNIVEHKFFDGFILCVVIASSVSLACEDIYLDSRPSLKAFLEIFNYVVTAVFTLEFLLKIFALGFLQYFSNAWNCLDFFIVVISVSLVANVGSNNGNLASFRSLRTLRALRPLRAIPRWQGMKVVVNSLLSSIPEIGNVSLVCLIFWLIFSVIGVQFFGGLFFKCVDVSGEILSDSVVPNKTTCLSLNYTWENSDINFDNSLAGLLALFQVATFEGWIEIMADAADATKVDQQPRMDSNHISHLYFVVFVLFGSFFVLNLFVGVIIDNFNRLKKQYEGHGAVALFLTDSQRAWYETLKKASGKKPRKVLQKPKEKWRAAMFDLVNSSRFEVVIMLLILANMAVMMIQHHGQSETVTKTLGYRSWRTLYCNLIFTVIFVVEALVRLYALRLDYFKEPWNDFDLIVVVLSIGGIVLEFVDRSFVVSPSIFRVVRVFRVGRLLRFYKNARGIRRLLFALLISLPALVNIGALLFLVLFIYAIIGMSSFAYLKYSGAINDMVNFETFGNSMLLLFRLSTSAGWNDVLDSVMIRPPDCDPTYDDLPNGNCGSPYFAIFYFVSFVLFTSLIIINMYIAVILENLHEAFAQEAAGITDDDIDMFYSKWEQFDPLATQYIPYSCLSDFVDSLEKPMRIPKPNKFACVHLNIPIRQGDNIHCVDVLQALVRHVLGDIEQENPEAFLMMQKKLEEGFGSAFPTRARQRTESTTFARNRETRAAIAIQKAWRARALQSKQVHEDGAKAFNGSLVTT